ncbi:MAG: DUF4097 domain-containing protein [Turicibacter sp.]|nr:DUF4097 domain-containing protein [Turicibacter sp.]
MPEPTNPKHPRNHTKPILIIAIIMTAITNAVTTHFERGVTAQYPIPVHSLYEIITIPADGLTVPSGGTLVVNVQDSHVRILPALGEDVIIEYTPPSPQHDNLPTIAFQDGFVEIIQPPQQSGFFSNSANLRTISIFLPISQQTTAFHDISISTLGGDITITGTPTLYIADSVTLHTRSGTITLEDFNARIIAASSTSGAVDGHFIGANEEILLNSISGAISARRINTDIWTGVITLSSTSGLINGFEIVANEIFATNNSGNVMLSWISTKKLTTSTTSGDIFITNPFRINHLNLDSASGSINLNNVPTTASRNLGTTSGNIRIDGQHQ